MVCVKPQIEQLNARRTLYGKLRWRASVSGFTNCGTHLTSYPVDTVVPLSGVKWLRCGADRSSLSAIVKNARNNTPSLTIYVQGLSKRCFSFVRLTIKWASCIWILYGNTSLLLHDIATRGSTFSQGSFWKCAPVLLDFPFKTLTVQLFTPSWSLLLVHDIATRGSAFS
jgi:hypothetical protein